MAKFLFTCFVKSMHKIQNIKSHYIQPIITNIKSNTAPTQAVAVKYTGIDDALNHSIGAFSKQDLKLIDFYKKILPFLHKKRDWPSYVHSYGERLVERFRRIYNITDTPTEEFDTEVTTIPYNVKRSKARTLHRDYLKLTALYSIAYPNFSEADRLSYSNFFNTNFGRPNTIKSKGIPDLKDSVISITGQLNKTDFQQWKKKCLKYMRLPFEQIIDLRQKIFDKLDYIYNSGGAEFSGNFSKYQINKMRNLLIKLLAIYKITEADRVNTRDLENLLLYDAKDYKVGDYIDRIGLITDLLTVNNKQTIIAATIFENLMTFKMYDFNYFKRINEFINNLPEECSTAEELETLNETAGLLRQQYENSIISEISFAITPKHDAIFDELEVDNSKQHEFKKITNSSYTYYITDFENHKKNDYPSAAKVLAFRLLKTMEDYNPNYPVLVYADNTYKSPASMYLKMGFKPLSKSDKYVWDNMNKNHYAYTDEDMLLMYLPNINSISEKLNFYRNIYFKDAESLASAQK